MKQVDALPKGRYADNVLFSNEVLDFAENNLECRHEPNSDSKSFEYRPEATETALRGCQRAHFGKQVQDAWLDEREGELGMSVLAHLFR